MASGIYTRRVLILGIGALTAVSAAPVLAQSRVRVKFAAGNDNTAVNGDVTGGNYNDYVLGAKKGQTMSVSLITEGTAYFNILPPGSSGQAIYNSSMNGNDAIGIRLPQSGDYTIRVYLMGADESERRTVPFMLSMVIM